MLPQMHKLFCVAVRSASGNNLQLVGSATCEFLLGTKFHFEFILCQNLKWPLIFGLDFLKAHKIGTNWPDRDKFILNDGKQIFVEAEKHTSPSIHTKCSIMVPARSLAVLNVEVDLENTF